MRIPLPHSVAEVEALACRRAVKNGSAALSTYSHMAAFKFVTLRVKLGYDHNAGTCVQGKLENRKVPGLLVSSSQFVFLRTRKSATGANIGHQEFFLFCLLFLDY